MPYAELNGIKIHYEVRGSGPPLLMMAPGGFDSTIEKWTTSGIWVGVKPLETLTSRYTCIAYDRRESGLSGGKVERVSWTTYAHEAKALLDLLNFPRAFVMGGCMGCSTATALAVTYPESTQGLVLHWPVGGVRWRQNGLERFQQHVNFLKEHGLAAVVELAREQGSFWISPEAGPWASTIVGDPDFAADFAGQDQDRYLAMVGLMGQMLFDRDTATGPEPQELMALTSGHHPRRGRSPRHLRRPLPARMPGRQPIPRRSSGRADSRPGAPMDHRVPGVPGNGGCLRVK